MSRIEKIWQRIDFWLASNAHELATSLARGNSESEIREAEMILGLAFPEDLRVSLSIHNGGFSLNEFKLLPLFGNVSIVSMAQLLLKEQTYRKTQRFPSCTIPSDDYLPFAQNSSSTIGSRSEHLMLVQGISNDTISSWNYGTQRNPYGRDEIEGRAYFDLLKSHIHTLSRPNSSGWEPLNCSFAEFLSKFADALENDEFVYDADFRDLRATRKSAVTSTPAAFTPKDLVIKGMFPGELEWEQDLQWWRGELCLSKTAQLWLNLVPEDTSAAFDMEAFVRGMQQIYKWIISSDAGLKAKAAESLLDDYNYEWKQRGPELNSEQFIKKLKLMSATIYESGCSYIDYSCGKLFLGHDIQIRINSASKVTEVVLVG